MPSSLLFVLLIVVWAFVLAPLVVRNREPIRRTSEALGRTRLLHSGGQRVKARPRPRFTADDVRRHADIDADLSVETVQAELEPDGVDEDVLIDDAPVNHLDGVIDGELLLELEEGAAVDGEFVDEFDLDETDIPEASADNPRVIADGGGRDLTQIIDRTGSDYESESAVSADVVSIRSASGEDSLHDDEAVFAAGYGSTLTVEPDSRTTIGKLREKFSEDVVDLTNMTTVELEELTEQLGDVFDLDEDDLEVEEFEILYAAGMDPDEIYAEQAADTSDVAADNGAEGTSMSTEMDDDDFEYAATHRGRGGYDPELDAQYTGIRFARRRRWVRVLSAVAVVAVALAIWLGGWVWLAPVAAVSALVGYLLTLRRTVVVERELRAKRIQMLKRRRLGVKTSDFDESLPDRLRRPGAIVVELDDEDPEFADLGYAVYDDEYELDRRAVG